MIDGIFKTERQIGELVCAGAVIGWIGASDVVTPIDGILRGLIRPGSIVTKGLKIGDIDPRGKATNYDTISEKATALGGSVLEAVLAVFNT